MIRGCPTPNGDIALLLLIPADHFAREAFLPHLVDLYLFISSPTNFTAKTFVENPTHVLIITSIIILIKNFVSR